LESTVEIAVSDYCRNLRRCFFSGGELVDQFVGDQRCPVLIFAGEAETDRISQDSLSCTVIARDYVDTSPVVFSEV
jgi:hypothetical protein